MTHKIKIQTDDSQNDYQTINSLIGDVHGTSKTSVYDITSSQSIRVFNNRILNLNTKRKISTQNQNGSRPNYKERKERFKLATTPSIRKHI